MPWTFIHPTKTGGTTLERFFETSVPAVSGSGHDAKVSASLPGNFIIVLRDPMRRAESIWRYYVSGSDISGPPGGRRLSFGEFWERVEKGSVELPRYMWNEHLLPQSTWLGPYGVVCSESHREWNACPSCRLNIPETLTILRNDECGTDSLRKATFEILDRLGVSYDPEQWKTVNVSTCRDSVRMDAETGDRLRRLFAEDIRLWTVLSRD